MIELYIYSLRATQARIYATFTMRSPYQLLSDPLSYDLESDGCVLAVLCEDASKRPYKRIKSVSCPLSQSVSKNKFKQSLLENAYCRYKHMQYGYRHLSNGARTL